MGMTSGGQGALPQGWVQTTLGELVVPSKERFDPNGGEDLPYVGLEHIERDTGRILGHGRSTEVKSTKAVFHAGDVLYGKLRPYLNKVAIPDFDGVCSTDILVFPRSEHIEPKFIYYRLLSKDFVQFANDNVSGVQHPRTNFQSLSNFRISLPPLAEQRRIVETLSKYASYQVMARNEISNATDKRIQLEEAIISGLLRGTRTCSWRERNIQIIPTSKSFLSLFVKGDGSSLNKKANELNVMQPDSERFGWIKISLGIVVSWTNGKGLTGDKMVPGAYPVYGGNGQTGLHTEYLAEDSAIVIGRVGAQCGNVHIAPR
jgi:type I restriction enzyme S subunit